MLSLNLYHVSTLLEKEPVHFVPRVPESRMTGEDETTPRICFSTDITECLKSLPDSYDGVYNKVYRQETEGVPALFSLFQTSSDEIESRHLVAPEELVAKSLVPDAVKHQEHWITKELLISPSSLIWIEGLERNGEDNQFHEIRYQKSVELFDRQYTFSFIRKSEQEDFRELLQGMDLFITEKTEAGIFGFAEGLYEIRAEIPAGVDISDAWVNYYIVRFQYEEELRMQDYKELLAKSSKFGGTFGYR